MDTIERLQRFEAKLDLCLEETLYDPTKFSITTGDDAVLDDIFSYQVYNKIKNHWAAAAVPADVQQGMIWYDTDDDRAYLYDGATSNELAQITGGMAGILFINDSANSKMATGITINQGAADTEIIGLKSSDVTHGCTDYAEADTFGFFSKFDGAAGGLTISGFRDNGTAAVVLRGFMEAANTAKNTGGRSGVEAVANLISGTGITNISADANVFGIRCQRGGSEETVFIVDEDGDVYYDGAASAYQAHDDVALIKEIEDILSGKVPDEERQDKDVYKKHKIIRENGRFISSKKSKMLLYGAIRQIDERLKALEAK